MKCKVVLRCTIIYVVASFLAGLNEATPAPTSDKKDGENLSALCQAACSKSGWKISFDKGKSACFCTVGTNIDESDQNILKEQAHKNGFTLIFIQDKIPTKNAVTTPAVKNIDISKSSHTEKEQEDRSKVKKKKKVEVSISSKKDKSSNKDIENVSNKHKNIDKNDSERTPKINFGVIEPKNIKNHELTQVSQNKRSPTKASKELEEAEETSIKEDLNKEIKTIKHEKKIKISGPILGDALPKTKLPKPIISPRRSSNNLCASDNTKRHLQTAKDRIKKLLDRMDQGNFNCALLNTEIDSIKTALTHANQRQPEIRHKNGDKSKLFEQIREKGKERQARIHSRLGHLELPKHKHHLVGGIKTTDKAPTGEEKPKFSVVDRIITEPEDLIET